MLFQRLYNWIKYKTLPPSFLFKNRLFIERDSKHRRVLTNFGLSFRNSKWSNYESYNIKNNFKNLYFRYIFWIFFSLVTLLFVFYFKKYYIFFYFFNNLSFFFWISIDTFDYYLSFLIWLATISLSLLFNILYSFFFFNNFSSNKNNDKRYNKLLPNYSKNFNLTSKDLYVSKHDLNWMMYSWLKNPNCKKNNKILENLFETSVNKNLWNQYYDFFTKLYKLSYLINLLSEKNTFFNLNINLNKLTIKNFKGDYFGLLNYFNNSNLLNNYSALILNYFLNNYKTYFDAKNQNSPSLRFLTNRFDSNLNNLTTENNKYSFLTKNKNGMFFFDELNYQKFSFLIFNFNELWSLNIYLKNQLNGAKWNRWLYRYSILHRKLLKNSHKLTLAKRLISSGFYDSKIFDKNIWASEHLGKFVNSNSINSIFYSYYQNLFSVNKSNFFNHKILNNNNLNQKNSLNLLNFYENSYFWYLKRFYLLNTLPTNFIKSKLNKKSLITNNIENKNNSFSKYSIFLSYLLKSSYSNLNLFSHFNNLNILIDDHYVNMSYENLLNFNFKDIYLLNNENDILTKDNLNILYWITSSSTNKNNVLFFNHLNLNDVKFKSIETAFFNVSNTNFSIINKWFILSLINTDKIYLNDITYLSLFY